jgi:hypothetical protein
MCLKLFQVSLLRTYNALIYNTQRLRRIGVGLLPGQAGDSAVHITPPCHHALRNLLCLGTEVDHLFFRGIFFFKKMSRKNTQFAVFCRLPCC